MLKTTDYGLPDPSGLLPARPIKVRRAGFADHYRLLVFSILLGFGAVAVVATIWPGLYADYRILRAPVEVPQASMVDGECRMRKFSVHCNATIAYPRDGAIQSRAINFSYLAFSNENRETRIVAERGNPDNITLSLAIDEFWNRFLGSLLVVVVFAVFSVLMMRRFLHQSASIKAMRHAAPLRPVWARITQRTDKRGRSRITYAPIDPAMTRKAIASGFARTSGPGPIMTLSRTRPSLWRSSIPMPRCRCCSMSLSTDWILLRRRPTPSVRVVMRCFRQNPPLEAKGAGPTGARPFLINRAAPETFASFARPCYAADVSIV